MFDIEQELKLLPGKPGIYIMHDGKDAIIYVGKAIHLRNRVRSYFRPSTQRSPKIERMVSQIVRFEYIVTDSELEALVLENNLIKEHRPKYNTMLKDDKTYPYIKVTLGEEFPRVVLSRELKRDKGRYFGPYTGGLPVKDTIDFVNEAFMLRTCNRKLPETIGRERPCLNYHLGKCLAPCSGDVSKEAYREKVEKALSFLEGNTREIEQELVHKMQQASERMDYEQALHYRTMIQKVDKIHQKQKVNDQDLEDRDIIAMARSQEESVIQVFFIRAGRMIGREHFFMTQTMGEESPVIMTQFIMQFYGGTPYIPRTLLLQDDLPEKEALEEWLSQKRGGRVHLQTPKKGSKSKLVELAATNATMVLEKDRDKYLQEIKKTVGAMQELQELLKIASLERVEAYDISNTSGFSSVGSMIVFEKGKPKKNDYRKFRIKSVDGPNDYASLKEVLTRRLAHLGQEEFAGKPDLLLIDGGMGQVHAVEEVLREMGLDIPIAGMVKDDYHRTRGLYCKGQEIRIPKESEGFRLLTRIQDEAHRFAITYHRSLRQKGQVHSLLDDIPGVGPARRKTLMREFADLQEIAQSPASRIAELPGFNQVVAESILHFLHERNHP